MFHIIDCLHRRLHCYYSRCNLMSICVHVLKYYFTLTRLSRSFASGMKLWCKKGVYSCSQYVWRELGKSFHNDDRYWCLGD